MNIENAVSTLLSKALVFDASILQNFTQSNIRNTSIHSSVKATLSFIDPRGKQVKVPLALCLSFLVSHSSWIIIVFDAIS